MPVPVVAGQHLGLEPLGVLDLERLAVCGLFVCWVCVVVVVSVMCESRGLGWGRQSGVSWLVW